MKYVSREDVCVDVVPAPARSKLKSSILQDLLTCNGLPNHLADHEAICHTSHSAWCITEQSKFGGFGNEANLIAGELFGTGIAAVGCIFIALSAGGKERNVRASFSTCIFPDGRKSYPILSATPSKFAPAELCRRRSPGISWLWHMRH